MDLQDPNASHAKSSELQNLATEIAVEFRQLLGFVESHNQNSQSDYATSKASFDTVTSALFSRLDALQLAAQPCDTALRERCAHLLRLLRAIADDVRSELASASQAQAQAQQYAARVPKNTAEAVNLIKSVLASAQSIGTPVTTPLSTPTSLSTPASPSFVSTPASPAGLSVTTSYPGRPSSPAPNSPARALPPIPFSPTTAPAPISISSPSQPATRTSVRPLSITRSSSSSHMPSGPSQVLSSHSSPQPITPIPVPSPTVISHTPVKRDAPSSPRNSSGTPSHSTSSPSPSLTAPTSPGLHRSASLPHHSPPSVSPLSFSSPAGTSSPAPRSLSPRRGSIGPKRFPSISIVPLVDGTTSVPSSSSFSTMTLLVDKNKDPALAKLVKSVSDSIAWITDNSLKAKMLAFFVGSTLGKIPAGDFDVCRNCAQNFAQLREKYTSDPCPIGEFTYGYARHRTLLYKYLADSVFLPARIKTNCSVLRDPSSTSSTSSPSPSPSPSSTNSISIVEVYIDSKWRVIDLVKDIGEIYEDDQKAGEYKLTPIIFEDEQPSKAEPASPSPSLSQSPLPSSPSPSSPPPAETTPSPDLSLDKSNGTGSKTTKPISSPSKPVVGSIRARSGTTSALPNRANRHSAYNPNSATLPNPNTVAGAGFLKQAAKAAGSGRVLRFPPENAEIILNERVGKGTFGDVYRCRVGGFTCAVKIVNIKSMSETSLKMMHNEIHFLETLNHENIIGFLGHEEVPRREIKIFMEFMPLSLASIIQKRNTTSYHFHKKDIIKCAKGMAEAISYLHHRKIIHRDIKSSNVLLEIDTNLDRIQEVRLCDFGVSKATSESANASTFTGTNLWVAPEVFDVQFGIAANYDEKCDIWSFGMVLVEMVTLNPPYLGLNSQQATQNIRNGIAPSLEVNPDIDPSIANLIFTCLKKVPSERPSASEIIGMLNQM